MFRVLYYRYPLVIPLDLDSRPFRWRVSAQGLVWSDGIVMNLHPFEYGRAAL